MRKTVVEKNGVRAGKTVRISVWRSKRVKAASVAVYCREGKGDFAPFVPHEYMDADTIRRMPIFQLMGGVLNDLTESLYIEFIAPVDMDIRVMQEVDLATDEIVTGRIKTDVGIIQAIRRICRNVGRRIRGLYVANVWG